MAHLGIRLVLVNDWDVVSGRKTLLDESPRINLFRNQIPVPYI